MLVMVGFSATLAEEGETTAWAALQAKIDSATAPVSIVLENDVEALPNEGNLYIGPDKTVTIDLHGHRIDRKRSSAEANGEVILVEGNLNVLDSVGGGRITGGNNSSGCAGVYINQGTFNLYSGTIDNNLSPNSFGGGVYIKNGTFNMTGGTITGNTGNYGGGVFNDSGNFNMSGGTISGNKANYGGALRGTLNVSGSAVIKDNTDKKGAPNNVDYLGGVIYVKGQLNSDALIYVHPNQQGVLTRDLPGRGSVSNFRSDRPDMDVAINKDGEVFIGTVYTVSFDVGIGVVPVEDQKVVSGFTAVDPKPTREGDTLLGWKTPDRQFFDFNTPITGDLSLTAAWAHPIVPHVDAAGRQAGYIVNYTSVTSDVTEWNGNSGNGWHVVVDDVTLDSVTVYGDTNLLICDHVTLTVNGGLYVKDGARLTFWVQSTDKDTMGKLIARGSEGTAGIGGHASTYHGAIVFNGGYIVANGGEYGAGIGGGQDRGSTSVTINDGYIEATGGNYGAGIGGGQDGGGGTVTINGGTVRATGGERGAGIGGSSDRSSGSVIINGGDVRAEGKGGGAGIGSGYYGDFDGSVTINGGTVEAEGCRIEGGAGIGAGFAGNADDGTVTINGGNVKALSLGNKGAGIGGVTAQSPPE